MKYNLTENTIQGPDFTCRYIAFGNGDRPMILIPGLSIKRPVDNARSLASMNRVFAKSYRVYVFDKREKLPAGFTVEDMAEDLAFCMEKLHLNGADILGISQGGMIAQYLAIHHPDLAGSLVLAVTLGKINTALRNLCERWTYYIENAAWDRIAEDVLQTMYSQSFIDKFGWIYTSAGNAAQITDPGRFLTETRACMTCDTLEGLSRISCPVFVIGSLGDRVVTAEASRELAGILHCPLYLYEKYGHALYEEDPADFTRRVLDFFTDPMAAYKKMV